MERDTLKSHILYLKCLVSGTISSAFSHLIFTPLDLFKTMKQSDISFDLNLKRVIKELREKGGIKNLYTGWEPTVLAYGLHGMIKYTTYEIMKSNMITYYGGDINNNRYRICSMSAFLAEFFANLLICPLEVLKIRLQSSTLQQFTNRQTFNRENNLRVIRDSIKNERILSLYKGLGLILLRQIPLTVSVFCTFEATAQIVYDYIYKKPRNELSVSNHLLVSLIASYASGSMICVFVSHPADTIITNIYKYNNKNFQGRISENVGCIIRENGVKGLFSGIYPRGFYIGFLIPTQLFLYDCMKVMMGLRTTASL
jgi:solute carrier family 25 phosphate transporter 3